MIYRLATSVLLAACCSTGFVLPSLAQTKKPPAGKARPAKATATPAKETRDLGQPQAKQAEAEAPAPEPAASAAAVPAAAPRAPKRKMVMVTDFDAGGLPNWWGRWDIGSLFANIMVSHLSRTDTFGVVERERMKVLFSEQDQIQDPRFRQESITKIGKLLGADLVLFGYLTTFSRKKSKVVFVDEYSASISFSARLVDISSGKVMKSVEVEYVSPKDRKFLQGKDEINPNDSDFLQSLFGKAINESVKLAVQKLTDESDGRAMASASTVAGNPSVKNAGANNFAPEQVQPGGPLKGVIAAVDGETIIINRGQAHGVKVGSFFTVTKVVKEIRDPENPKIVIRQQLEEVARIKVTKVEATSCDGVVVSSKVKLKEKDTVVLAVD